MELIPLAASAHPHSREKCQLRCIGQIDEIQRMEQKINVCFCHAAQGECKPEII